MRTVITCSTLQTETEEAQSKINDRRRRRGRSGRRRFRKVWADRGVKESSNKLCNQLLSIPLSFTHHITSHHMTSQKHIT